MDYHEIEKMLASLDEMRVLLLNQNADHHERAALDKAYNGIRQAQSGFRMLLNAVETVVGGAS